MWYTLLILSSVDYTVTVVSDPPGVPVDGVNNSFGYLAGSSVKLTCLVIPTPPAYTPSHYNWNCSAGCSDNTGMEQIVNFTGSESEAFHCSITINSMTYDSGSYELQLLGEQKLCFYSLLLVFLAPCK